MHRLLVCLIAATAVPVCAQQPAQVQTPQVQAGVAPQPPANFQNSPADQDYLNTLLATWEKKSSAVVNFRCKFARYTYNSFGVPPGSVMPEHQGKFSEATGELSYRAPDRGSFEVTQLSVWTPKPRAADATGPIEGSFEVQKDGDGNDAGGEHWVCDGKSIYEFKQQQKELVERPIPPEMQGQRIVDGPLPFLFGAEAEKLKARYWFRICREPSLTNDSQLCIQAMPKYQADAANYKTVLVIFDMKHEYLMPKGIVVYHPDNSRDSYSFDLVSAQINRQFGQLFEAIFSAPRTPFGWKKVVVQQPADPTRQASGQAPEAR